MQNGSALIENLWNRFLFEPSTGDADFGASPGGPASTSGTDPSTPRLVEEDR